MNLLKAEASYVGKSRLYLKQCENLSEPMVSKSSYIFFRECQTVFAEKLQALLDWPHASDPRSKGAIVKMQELVRTTMTVKPSRTSGYRRLKVPNPVNPSLMIMEDDDEPTAAGGGAAGGAAAGGAAAGAMDTDQDYDSDKEMKEWMAANDATAGGAMDKEPVAMDET